MAVAFGGAALLAAIATPRPRPPPEVLLGIAAAYERAFWAAVGVLVMTGVGNAAAFGRDLPYPDSAWGTAFVAKLLGIAALIVLSVPRTLVVVQLGAGAREIDGALVERLYIATASALVAILAVAVWLAHG
jgi:putative copper export protein